MTGGHRRLLWVALACAATTPSLAQGQGSLAVEAQLAAGEETSELEALRAAELAMFGPQRALVQVGQPVVTEALPAALTSEAPATTATTPRASRDLSWLAGLTLPDMPIRWDERVVRYLEYFKDDRRGRSLMSAWMRRSTRYGAMIAETLRDEQLPEDLRCVAMAESGFDPTVRSRVGAAGMWQFVTRTGAEYGLAQNHWVDQRMDPIRSTRAAARYLRQLYRRFGSWELALTAYNMGYGALLRAIRKFNTNDYWVLASLEAGLPFETTIYVAKIMACTVVMRNPERFGFGELVQDPPLEVEAVEVPGGTPLSVLARSAGMDTDMLSALNPELRRRRTPAGRAPYRLLLPAAQVEEFTRSWARRRPRHAAHQSYVVRFGERLADVAHRFRTTARALRSLNELDRGEAHAGFAMLVPAVAARAPQRDPEPPVVAVPDADLIVDGRRRVFYRVTGTDTVREVARFFGCSRDELRRWNHLDPAATLPRGLVLQLFVTPDQDLAQAVVLSDEDVRLVTIGSEEFFEYHETQRGRVRFRYTVRPGDTLTRLGRRFGLSIGSIARINRFSRRSTLQAGQVIIIYTAPENVPAAERSQASERAEPATPEPTAAPEAATPAQETAAQEPEVEAQAADDDDAPAEQAEPASDGDAPTDGPESAE